MTTKFQAKYEELAELSGEELSEYLTEQSAQAVRVVFFERKLKELQELAERLNVEHFVAAEWDDLDDEEKDKILTEIAIEIAYLPLGE